MNCLHICNDLMGSKVHENLYDSLEKLGVNQKLYYPLRKEKQDKISKFQESLKEYLIVSKPLKKYHRFLFRNKINFLFKDLKRQIDLKQFDLVHATTLFSDGAIALKIWKKYKIPYIVAIRGTDINAFFKYRPDLYPLAKEIIYNAQHLIFISDSLHRNFLNHKFIKRLDYSKLPQQKIIFNGLDDFWLNNIFKTVNTTEKPSKFTYIGKFDNNKNVLRLIQAFLQLNKKYGNLHLNLVGSGGAQESEIKAITNKTESIKYHGPIYNKKELQSVYLKSDIFAMASISETFGLVYVEALSQNLPILFSKNQGIDGTFNNIGESVDPLSINSIANGMEKMISNYHEYHPNIKNIDFSTFSWKEIGLKYFQLYQTIITKK